MNDIPLTSKLKNAPSKVGPKQGAAAPWHCTHWVIVAISFGLTFFAWHYSKTQKVKRIEALFDREADQVTAQILERMRKYEDALTGGVAMIDASGGEVDFHSWRKYADSLDIEHRYPGINGIGVIHALSKESLPAYLAEQRKQRPDFHIHPAHMGSEYYPISYIIPVAGNEEAVGLDMVHERNRYSASKKARDSGKSQITGPITLVQDSNETPGFLFFKPFYREGADGQRQFAGLVYAPFVTKRLMLGTLQKEQRNVGIRLVDGTQVIYDEHVPTEQDFDAAPAYTRSVDVPIFGRTWTFDIRSANSFRQASTGYHPLVILVGGIFVDFLVILLLIALSRASHSALRFASAMEGAAETNLAILNSTSDGIITIDERGDIENVNKAFQEIFGYTADELRGQNVNMLLPSWDQLDHSQFVANYLLTTEKHSSRKRREASGMRKDGTVLPLELNFTKFTLNDRQLFTGSLRDISERKEAEDVIRRSEERFELAMRGSSDGLWDWNLESDEIYFSPRWKSMLGYGEDELEPHFDSAMALIHADDKQHVLDAIDEFKSGQSEQFEVEFRMRHKDRGYLHILSRGFGVRRPGDNKLLRMVGTHVDMTERKKTQEELRKRGQQLERQTKALDQFAIVAETDARGRITYVNDKFCEISKYSREELLRQDHRIVNSGHHPKSFFREMYSTIRRGRVWRGEIMNKAKDDSIYWVDTVIVPFINDAGKVEKYLAIRSDITERKKAELAVRTSEEKLNQFRTTLDQTHDCVFMFRPDTLRFYYVNEGAAKHIGYSTDELMQMGPLDIKPNYSEEQLHGLLQPLLLREQKVLMLETVHRHKDGHDIPVEITLQYIAPQAEPPRFVAIVRDISYRIRVEQSLIEAKKEADRASEAKSQFLASMSHELRTPLNGVIGMTELLAGTELNSKQQQFVDACRNSGEALLQLINDVLDFSKIEAGKVELEEHEFDLENLVIDTVETMAWRAADKALEMPCFVDQMSRLILKGDSNRVRQVLVNLLGNAVKFTDVGEVVVRTKIVERQNDQIRVRFSVIDTGDGIPLEKRDRLFQLFSQVDASTTRIHGGTGLGLSISQGLVELMGGTIGVESEVGVGSTFWFEVPFAVASESSEAIPNNTPLSGMRGLIVDDNETNRVILEEYSTGWGLASVSTASVDEALAAVEQSEQDGTPFHFVMTDYNMPQRDGLELAAILKEYPQLVVLLLGSTDVNLNPEELTEHGIDAILRKPLRRREMHDVLCGLIVDGTEIPAVPNEQDSPLGISTPSSNILLVEDNSINQMYMVELLKQLDCTCDTVGNGLEALEAVQQNEYDLVLMDCQMPVLDGFEATRRIRQLETGGALGRQVPIVALTANAVKGDRERCLDAGMDDYLSKPVQKQQVLDMLELYCSWTVDDSCDDETTSDASEGPCESSDSPPIEAKSLLARCFGDLEFAGSLLDEIESTGSQRVDEIRQFAAQQNADATADAAHALKGAAGIFCAETMQKMAAEIEKAGRSSCLDEIEYMIRDLSVEMQRCLDHLPQIREEMQLINGKNENESTRN